MRQDDILVPRASLKAVIEHVERVRRAAQHAVRISSQARDAFENEASQVDIMVSDLRAMLDRL